MCTSLLEKKFYVCGTLRLNRGGPDLKSIKKETKAGNIKIYQKNFVNLFVFKEKASKNPVCIISTFHNLQKEDDLTQCSDFVSDIRSHYQSSLKESFSINGDNETREKPQFIIDYNNNMGGVGLTDQLMKNYSIYRKNKRWVNKMTSFILQCSLHNAYITYRNMGAKPCSHAVFRESPFYSIISSKKEVIKPEVKINSKNSQVMKPINIKKDLRKGCQNKNMHTDVEKRANLTFFQCQDCMKYFCYPECYNDYHSRDDCCIWCSWVRMEY